MSLVQEGDILWSGESNPAASRICGEGKSELKVRKRKSDEPTFQDAATYQVGDPCPHQTLKDQVRPAPPSARMPETHPESVDALYSVGLPKALRDLAIEKQRERAERPPEKKLKQAVFVAHGMGQQIPFQTLDQVAEGLRCEDARRRGVPIEALPKPSVRAVRVGDDRLQRAELKLATSTGEEREVHIYEAYWAPLTEGQVKLRDVISFLLQAGSNGIHNGRAPFKRWLFGRYTEFPLPIRSAIYLPAALLVVASLGVMNAAIIAVAAARSPMTTPPAWLSGGLLADLLTTFNFYLGFVVAFGLFLVISKLLGGRRGVKRLRLVSSTVSLLLFVAVIFATIVAGVFIPLVFYYHVQCARSPGRPEEFWYSVFPLKFVTSFNNLFESGLVLLIFAAVLYVVLAWAVKTVVCLYKEFAASSPGRIRSLFVVLAFLALISVVSGEAYMFTRVCDSLSSGGMMATLSRGVSWPVLVAVSWLVRTLLVQYAGDVAAYVTPHTLDKFSELREKIKATVLTKARSVYAALSDDGSGYEYERVSVVGHSLGSVIVYDTLNRLINEDSLAAGQVALGGAAAGAQYLGVLTRTQQLVTFGSPLDKTAFLFALQGGATSEAREALAATVQPLIQDFRFRTFEWTNVYSPWDIISGPLELYDLPDRSNPNPVDNVSDPEASTLLVAHTEYWKNRKVFEVLYHRLTK